jgi:hypothetical protein
MNETQRTECELAILEHMLKYGITSDEPFRKDQNMNYFVTNIDGKECLIRYIVDTDGIVSDLPSDLTIPMTNSYVWHLREAARLLRRREMLKKRSL